MPASSAFPLGLAAAVLAAALPAAAQITTATVRGQISAQGQPQPGAAVVATNVANGYATRTTSGDDGGYVFAALAPGSYRIVVNAPGQIESAQRITLRVGQNVSLNLSLDPQPPEPTETDETIVVTGLRDARTSEIGTYVTPKQIAALPQTRRNFLAFADLAPGVVVTAEGGDGNKPIQMRGGAQSANAVNVYIDGIGQKNYVIGGGITGQDSSRGNPFPQSAVAEYKVITQNYKAEFDQVSGAAVAAVTRSGSNVFHGEVFWDHSTTAWRASTPAEQREGRKVPSKDDQYGLWMGGAILVDRMHWFFAYEGKAIDAPKAVVPGQGRTVADLPAQLQGLVGPTNEPFREDLLFGKIDWILDDANLLELSLKLRREDDVTSVGGLNAASYGTSRQTDETRVDLHYQLTANDWVNDSHLTYEDATFSPRARTSAPGYVLTTHDPGQVILNAGGGRDYQNKSQQGYALQNDFTWTGLDWYGSHVVKTGIKFKQVTVDAQEQNPVNAQYAYDIGFSTIEPYQVVFGAPLAGIGDGRTRSRNQQLGLYVQDDWEVNKNLTLNLGLRWDYERSPGYLDYVTPADVVGALHSDAGLKASGIDISRYISTGSNRKTFKDALQPRVGFSLDLNADQQHVIFGGYGRAYDRNIFDYMQLERTKATFPQYTFFFDSAAHPCDSNCLQWDPGYYDPAALAALASGTGAGREIDLLDNHLKTPYSDQISVGMRNRVGAWNTEVTLSRVESHDGFVFLLGNRLDDGSFFLPGTVWGPPFGATIPGFGSLILGTNGLETRAKSLFLKTEKPYSDTSGWGAGVAYTYTDAKENRQFGEHYALDYPSLDGYGWKPAGGVSKHRVVATGILDAPWQTVLAMRLTLATHAPRYGTNCLAGLDQCFIDQIEPAGKRFVIGGPIWGYRQIDVALTKSFSVPGGTLKLRADLINVFNAKNYDGYDTWWGTPGNPNANLGQPDGSLLGPTRKLKLGIAYSW